MELKKRKKLRLENYNYSECGAYFVTICVDKKYGALLWEFQESETVGADNLSPTLSKIVGSMKGWASKQTAFPLWQKSFYL